MPRPDFAEYGTYFQRYIDYTPGNDARQVIETSVAALEQFLSTIPEEKLHFAYNPGKWTVAQLLQHVIDTERVFAYRAMCIARGEEQGLPGFDENVYAENATATNRTLSDLTEELLLVRKTTLILYKYIDDKQLFRKGIASNNPITPNAIAFIIVGHVMHHQKILTERYFSAIASALH
ncbi:MAG: DinB family protein [Bacteroidota bacterium]